MAKVFNSVPGRTVKRNMFNLSHERKMTANMGELIPILCQDVLPGDTFRVNSEIMLRTAPLLAPIMHRINVYTHYFFVPYRIIWDEAEKFFTNKETVVFPRIRINSTNYSSLEEYFNAKSLSDYIGIPPIPEQTGTNNIEISELPFRAYKLIFDEFYRDQDLVEEVELDKSSGVRETVDNYLEHLLEIKKRAWEKDYFTSARPWAQKGDEVTLPIGDSVPVELIESDPSSEGGQFVRASGGAYIPAAGGDLKMAINLGSGPNPAIRTVTDDNLTYNPRGTLIANLNSATIATINELRRAFQLQKWLERNARAGSRYKELLLAHFGVRTSDSRLQRPEYLGGGRQPISISEVLQTSQSTEDSSLGEFAGHGISIGNSNRFKRFFEEHGVVIGLMSIIPRTAYQQGIPRNFQKFDVFDHYWPEFAHIGEQEIKMSELFVQDSNAANSSTFGYTPRYTEYKYIPSTVHGDMRTSLNHFHLGRIFENEPQLNEEFVECNPDSRIFPVLNEEEDKLWIQIYNNVKALRPIPVFSEPGLIDH